MFPKKILIFLTFLIISLSSIAKVHSIEPDIFVQSTVNRAAKTLSGNLSKDLYIATKAISGVDFRAKNIESIDNLKKNSMDFYASVRSLYLQDRQQKIANSNPTIEIMYEGDWEEIESQ